MLLDIKKLIKLIKIKKFQLFEKKHNLFFNNQKIFNFTINISSSLITNLQFLPFKDFGKQEYYTSNAFIQ